VRRIHLTGLDCRKLAEGAVIGLMAAILASLHMWTADDLFDGPLLIK
jgi:hypothetical protein